MDLFAGFCSFCLLVWFSSMNYIGAPYLTADQHSGRCYRCMLNIYSWSIVNLRILTNTVVFPWLLQSSHVVQHIASMLWTVKVTSRILNVRTNTVVFPLMVTMYPSGLPGDSFNDMLLNHSLRVGFHRSCRYLMWEWCNHWYSSKCILVGMELRWSRYLKGLLVKLPALW